MPLVGQAKKDDNFCRFRVEGQSKFWPEFVAKWDDESNGQRYKSEVKSLTELWKMYLGGVDTSLSEEEEARGKKPSKDKPIRPCMARYIPGPYSDEGYLHFDQWLRARDKARKDLYWLGKSIFNCDFAPNTHQVVCDQFVQKNFDGVYKQGYGLRDFQAAMSKQNRVPRIWVETDTYRPKTLDDFGKYMSIPFEQDKPENYARLMILMDPRGFFKSTIDGLDCVQWIINCPDIRILIMAGVYKLAIQFLQGIKRRFYLPRGIAPSAFHLLFPEYVIRGIDGDSKEPLVTETRVHESLDPTLGVISVGSSLSGFHCDILKFDDVVTDENCNTIETREALHEKADGSQNLLMPWGWTDIIGTRYFPDDYYGLKLIKHEEDPEEHPLKFFKRACWTPKLGFEEVGLRDLTEEMVILTFPEHADFKSLRKKLKDNEKLFRCQQLNEPVWNDDGFKVQFTEDLLKSHIIPAVEANKKLGDTYITGDLSKTTNKYSDFSCLVAARTYRKEDGTIAIAILEVRWDRWTQSQQAYELASFVNKWMPKSIVIEDTGGLELLKREVQTQSSRHFGTTISNIYWKPVENNRDAKKNRVKALEILLKKDQLYFADGPWIDETFKQFINFTGKKSGPTKKDDIPDAASFLPRFLPSTQVVLTVKEQAEKAEMEEAEYKRQVMMGQYKRIFGSEQVNKQPVLQIIDIPQPQTPLDATISKLGLGGLFRRN